MAGTSRDPNAADVDSLATRAAARPADPVAHARLAVALRDAGDGGDDALTRATGLIRASLSIGATSVAREAAHILEAGCSDPALIVLAAEAAIHDGATAEGRAKLEALVAGRPELASPRVILAALALVDGRPEEALNLVEPVATTDEESRAAYLQTLLAAGRKHQAWEFAVDSVAAYPDAAALYQFLGIACLATERASAAVDAFSEALRLAPARPGVHHNLAVAMATQGSLAGALGVVDAGLELTPDDPGLAGLRIELLGALERGRG